MTKIISFTGSQGSGKTTMRNELVDKLMSNDHTVYANYAGVVKSISRDANDEGFAINEGTDFEAQYYMASKYISADLLTRKMAEIEGIDYIVTDRSVIDVIPYTTIAPAIMYKERQIISNMLIAHLELYPVDLMILCNPISNLERDGLRSGSVKFSEEIHKVFVNIVTTTCYPDKLCVLENDTLENRMKIVYEQVEEIGRI